MIQFSTIEALNTALNNGAITSLELTKNILEKISKPNGEGSKVYLSVYKDQALAAAKASDELRAAGLARSPLEGLPISIKDLFDYKGDITKGASVVLNNAPTATKNATLVQRLINAGAIIIGRTNMTEFAFSGLGINPHYGTPKSPWQREIGRIPGGSSSGAAVSVTDGMAIAAIGTDTGGSIRIPSAFCGLTGFKPTANRIPTEGVMPLSQTLDSFGPLGRSVTCCSIIDSIISGENNPLPQQLDTKFIRLALPTNYVFNDADEIVLNAFNKTIDNLQKSGILIEPITIPEFDELPEINKLGGFVGAEAWFNHRDLISSLEHLYDPKVASRILKSKKQSAADYIKLLHTRKHWISKVNKRLGTYDALILPTTPIIAPTLHELEDEDIYFKKNALILRNPSIINFLNGCAISLPCHLKNEAPVGLMLASTSYKDQHLLDVAFTVENLLKSE